MHTYTHILPLAPLAPLYAYICTCTCTYTLLYAHTCIYTSYMCMLHVYHICIYVYAYVYVPWPPRAHMHMYHICICVIYAYVSYMHMYLSYIHMYLGHPGQRAAALRVPAALPLACVRCHGRGVNTRVFARSRRRSPLLNSTSRRDPSGPYHPPPLA